MSRIRLPGSSSVSPGQGSRDRAKQPDAFTQTESCGKETKGRHACTPMTHAATCLRNESTAGTLPGTESPRARATERRPSRFPICSTSRRGIRILKGKHAGLVTLPCGSKLQLRWRGKEVPRTMGFVREDWGRGSLRLDVPSRAARPCGAGCPRLPPERPFRPASEMCRGGTRSVARVRQETALGGNELSGSCLCFSAALLIAGWLLSLLP